MDNELSVIIGNRINTLLAERGKKQKELSEYLGGIPENTISYFCSGKRIPNTSQIKKIAEFFDVSSDYLLGIVDNPSKDVRHVELTELTGLDDDAIEELASKHLAGWRDDIPLGNKTMNDFISFGFFDTLICEMTAYSFYLKAYIEDLQTIYQEAQETYEQLGLRIVVTDEYKKLTSAASGSYSSPNTQKMKLSLFDMSELPKEFVRVYFSFLQNERDDVISDIKRLDKEIRKKNNEQTNSIIKQAEQDIKEREAQKHGDNPET